MPAKDANPGWFFIIMTREKKIKQSLKVIKKLPWGEKIYLEVPIFKFRNQMIARFGENAEGRKYIEISKFGPLPQGAIKDGSKTTYSQKLRLYKPGHWGVIKKTTEETLFPAIV